MSIQVFVRRVYGRAMIYPYCERAKVFALLTGQKTLDQRSVELIRALGFKVDVVADPEVSV
jgi:hypothetical protein